MAFLKILALSLIFVTAGMVGCEAKTEKVRKRTGSGVPSEPIKTVENRLSGEPGVVEIRLNQIWALDMPGTLGMDKLVPGYNRKTNSWKRIRRLLAPKQPAKKAATGIAFAIKQNWPNELDKINQILEFSRRSNSVPVTEEVGIVFYSNASAYRVEIEQVERRGSVVNICYRLIPYHSDDPSRKTSVDLAIIPLGKLPAGEYRVEMIRAPLAQKYLDAGHKPVSDEQASRFVCQPFTFEVWNLPKPDPGLSEGAIEIPLDQIWTSYTTSGTHDIQSLDLQQLPQPFFFLSSGPLSLLERLGKNKAEPGFVVAEIGQEALIAAHQKLPEGEKPANALLVGTEITVVYFSNGFASSIDLHRVERRGNFIDVRYVFNLAGSGGLSQHMALIPLGKLSVGEYRVNMMEVSPKNDWGIPPSSEAHLRVCQSFSFSIVEAIEEEQ